MKTTSDETTTHTIVFEEALAWREGAAGVEPQAVGEPVGRGDHGSVDRQLQERMAMQGKGRRAHPRVPAAPTL